MVEMSDKEFEMRVDFIKYQIKEADKRLEKARLALRSSFKHKQKLLDMLKEEEIKLEI